ncbi:glutamine--fructose-6-phosphate transaminase (isomerizing) [Membranihabitans marinus]
MQDAVALVMDGLKKLEYRGYDSAGIAINNNGILIHKRQGKLEALSSSVPPAFRGSKVAIGHTRWATHGSPNIVNAHPHVSADGKIAMVHNGIIENYETFRSSFGETDIQCEGETDSEVLVKYIALQYQEPFQNLEEVVAKVLSEVQGSYSLVIMEESKPHKIIAARRGSPLVVGRSDDGYYLASDILPILPHTRKVVYLEDGEIVVIENNQLQIFDFSYQQKQAEFQYLNIDLHSADKTGYKHYMLKEIHEQPKALRRGHGQQMSNDNLLPELQPFMETISKAGRIIILGCGTSWHAGLVAEYVIEKLCRVPVEVEYASEFRYRDPVIYADDVIVALSQSGETADTLVALEEAKKHGALLYGVVNVPTSSIARLVDVYSNIFAGPEISVASTKAFICQLNALYLFAIKLGKYNGNLSPDYSLSVLKELRQVPDILKNYLSYIVYRIKNIAMIYSHVNHTLFLGRGLQFPIALEGALKLKEVSYIHAEGYPAAEMKHGPIALIEKGWPVIIIALKSDPHYKKVLSNIEEIKARGGSVIGIISEGDESIKDNVENWIEIPRISFLLSPMFTVIPMQLLAYYIGLHKGCDIDKPRNLAKSVTVE